MNELLGLPYSPWSEKARWALDARKVPYKYKVYAPLVGEPALRFKLKKWSGPVSVPLQRVGAGEAGCRACAGRASSVCDGGPEGGDVDMPPSHIGPAVGRAGEERNLMSAPLQPQADESRRLSVR